MQSISIINDGKELLDGKSSMINEQKLKNDFKNVYETNDDILKNISNWEFNLIKKLDLSNRRLTNLPRELDGLINLTDLNISNNEFTEVPVCLYTGMKSIEILDLSKNKLKHFSEPACIAKLKILKLESNHLENIPRWITVCFIRELHLNGNNLLFSNKMNYQNEPSLAISTRISIVDTENDSCKFSPYLENVFLGLKTYCDSSNTVQVFPFDNILECSDLKQVNLENVQLSDVSSEICRFQNLIHINFSNNFLMWMPDEFCQLTKLEECILSYNSLIFLPKDFGNLRNLKTLHLNDNKLEGLPASMASMYKLVELDLYDNNITEYPDICNFVDAIDYAKNIDEEPMDESYTARKEKLRKRYSLKRLNGNKYDYSWDYEERQRRCATPDHTESLCDNEVVIEDDENWDTDEYWEPPAYTRRCLSPIRPLNEDMVFVNGQFDDQSF